MNNGFSASQALSQAWKLLKGNAKFFASAILLSIIILGVIQFLTAKTEHIAIVSFLVTVISVIVSLALTIGWVNVVLRLIRGTSQKWEDFKTEPKIWGKVFVNQILISFPIIVAIALAAVIIFAFRNPIAIIIMVIVAIIVAVYIQIRFMFLNHAAIDNQNLGIIALLKKAAKITKGHTLDLLGFGILMLLVNIGGLLLLGIGLFVTIPLSMIAQVFVYEKITGKSVTE